MAIPTVYTSADSGAPTLPYATNGSLLAVLRAVLVTGYGSKAGAGWTELYTDAPNHKAVFQNAGSGFCLQVHDTPLAGAYYSIPVTGYRTMSDVDTGTDPTHTRYWNRRPYTTSPANIDWYIVATDTTFYGVLTINGHSTSNTTFMAAGDIISFVTGDSFPFFVAGAEGINNANLTPLNTNGHSSATGDMRISFAKDHTGTAGPLGYGFNLPNWSGGPGGSNYPASPSVTGADDAFTEALIVRPGVLRGKFPGLLLPMHTVTGSLTGHTRTDNPGGTGSEAILFRNSGGSNTSSSGVYVETALDWGL